jgi:putative phage-type endonuclease
MENTDDELSSDDGSDSDLSSDECGKFKEMLSEYTSDDYNELTETIYEILYELSNEYMSDPNYRNGIEDIVLKIMRNIIPKCSDLKSIVYNETQLYYELYGDLHIRSINPTCIIRKPDILKMQQSLVRLRAIPQPIQRTSEWYETRNNMLTASNIWKAFGSDAQINSLIFEKCNPVSGERMNGGGSLQWGTMYETVSVKIYEDKYKTIVEDFGCIGHPIYKYIGASPDGINVDICSERYGRMIEVKNIVNREITGIPKEEYWVQMQVQMETCDLDECDFIETRFKQYDNETDFYADKTHEYKGAICVFIERDILARQKSIYRYSGVRETQMKKWIEQTKNENSEYILFSVIYWYLDQFSCVLVQRNRQWFSSVLPKITDVWKTIEKERITGCEHRATKKRDIKSVCLVKLD